MSVPSPQTQSSLLWRPQNSRQNILPHRRDSRSIEMQAGTEGAVRLRKSYGRWRMWHTLRGTAHLAGLETYTFLTPCAAERVTSSDSASSGLRGLFRGSLASVYGPIFCKRPNKFSHQDSVRSDLYVAVTQ